MSDGSRFLRGRQLRDQGDSVVRPPAPNRADYGRWPSWRAMDEAIGPGAMRRTVARELGISRSTVDKWCEDPAESGERNPLDRVVKMVEILRAHDRPEETVA